MFTGSYNEHSSIQSVIASSSNQALVDAVEMMASKVKLDGRDNFVIADFGSSHGANSMEPMKTTIFAVRKHFSPTQPIAIYHTDLPKNDFNALFETIHSNKDSYMTLSTKYASIHSFASASSFYQQILPPSSLHLGFSSTAVHWLSTFPCETEGIYYSQSNSENEIAIWREQAAKDWDEFLFHRSKELVPGGSLVISTPMTDEEGNPTGKNMSPIMSQVREEMLASGMITKEQARRFTASCYFRSKLELVSPLSKHKLYLQSIHPCQFPNPVYVKYQGDWEAFGKAMSDWIRAWYDVSLRRAVTDEKVINFFYQRIAELLAVHHDSIKHHVLDSYIVVITKEI